MYTITKNGIQLSIEDNLVPVKLNRNNIYVPCELTEADGLVIGNDYVEPIEGLEIRKSAFGSSTAYPGGTLDNTMTSIYNSLPEKLQSKIMDATFALEGSGSITRKVFALTYTMAGFGANNGTTEGKALQHYNSNANRIKKYNGSADGWWLSSRSRASFSRLVSSNGSANYDVPSYSYGVVPAFAIPQSVMLEDSANTDGSYNIKYAEKNILHRKHGQYGRTAQSGVAHNILQRQFDAENLQQRERRKSGMGNRRE